MRTAYYPCQHGDYNCKCPIWQEAQNECFRPVVESCTNRAFQEKYQEGNDYMLEICNKANIPVVEIEAVEPESESSTPDDNETGDSSLEVNIYNTTPSAGDQEDIPCSGFNGRWTGEFHLLSPRDERYPLDVEFVDDMTEDCPEEKKKIAEFKYYSDRFGGKICDGNWMVAAVVDDSNNDIVVKRVLENAGPCYDHCTTQITYNVHSDEINGRSSPEIGCMGHTWTMHLTRLSGYYTHDPTGDLTTEEFIQTSSESTPSTMAAGNEAAGFFSAAADLDADAAANKSAIIGILWPLAIYTIVIFSYTTN